MAVAALVVALLALLAACAPPLAVVAAGAGFLAAHLLHLSRLRRAA